MELIFVILLLIFGPAIFITVIKSAGKTVKAAGKTVIGKGSMKENMELEFKGMGSMQIRLHSNKLESEHVFLEVQCKGLFPINFQTRVGFMVSVLTKDFKGETAPVLSLISEFQEPNTIAFQDLTVVGEVSGEQGYMEWIRIGIVPLEILQSTFGGRQQLLIVTRLVDMDNIPAVSLGFEDPDSVLSLWSNVQEYEHIFINKGYREEAENIDKARALSIEIGMAVAMADGGLDDTEGAVLKEWIEKVLDTFDGEKEKELKKVYNDAMKSSYQLAESGDLVLGNICKQLNDIGEAAQKYEALELAHKVMAADGIVHAKEMKVIHKVADALGIDADELASIRDQQIVALDVTVDNLDLESLLGIDPSWSNSKTLKHLRQEYQKWNSRLNTLPEGSERENAQKMLDSIAKARKRYGG